MALDVKFYKGKKSNLSSQNISSGSLYFVISDENKQQGEIYFDNGTKRYQMGAGLSGAKTKTAQAICASGSSVSSKVLVLQDDTWVAENGSTLLVQFSETNIASTPSFTIVSSDSSTNILSSIPVFYSKSQILVDNLEKAGSKDFILQYMFDGKYFHYVAGLGDESKGRYYDINIKDYLVGDYDISAYSLVGQDMAGRLISVEEGPFMINGPLYISETAHSANESGKNSNFYSRHYNIQIKYNGAEIQGSAYDPLYLVGTIANGVFNATGYTSILPTGNTDKCYMLIGEFTTSVTFNGNHSYINLDNQHPIFVFKNDEIELYAPPAKLEHSLTIGTEIFNGTKDVVIPIYQGEY